VSERPAVAHRFLIDVHVHVQENFDHGRFYRAALGNFRVASSRIAAGGPWTACLVLTETGHQHEFERLHDDRLRKGRRRSSLLVGATPEPEALWVRPTQTSESILVVAGRQLVSSEGIEVLVFPTREEAPAAVDLDELLRDAARRRKIAVLPWGFGKWWGRRGTFIRSILLSNQGIFVADTGHRPRGSRRPRLLVEAEAQGVPVLAGSDPLPLPGEQERAGSTCFALMAPKGPRPLSSIVRGLRELRETPPAHVSGPNPATFILKQLAMQVRKRQRASVRGPESR
jgi:hypothetical protein